MAISYLYNRNGIWQAQKFVKDSHGRTKKLRRSLHTGDRIEALKRVGIFLSDIETYSAKRFAGKFVSSPTQNSDILLAELIAQFEEFKLGNGSWTDRTRRSTMQALQSACEMLNNPELSLIDDKRIVRLRDSLKAKSTPLTVNRILKLLRDLFRYAVDSGLMQKSPIAKKLLIRNAKSDRTEFNDAQMGKILSGDAFIGELKWIVRIAAYAGLRNSEITYLYKEDVKFDASSGCWYFDINREHGKSVKNENSVRLVPVHSQLIREGFIDWIQSLADDARLFPTFSTSKTSSAFKAGLVSLGIRSNRLVFHSLRYTWASRMGRAGVLDTLTLQLGGWSKGASTFHKTYFRGFKNGRQLQEAIDSVSYVV